MARPKRQDETQEKPYYENMAPEDQTVQAKDLPQPEGTLDPKDAHIGDGVKLNADEPKAKPTNADIIASLENGEDTYSKEYALVAADKVEANHTLELVKEVKSKGRDMALVKVKA